MDAAGSEEINACGTESIDLLGKLSLERKVESALLETGLTSPHIFTTVEDADTVRVYGLAHSAEEKAKVEDRLKQIDGVKQIHNEMTVFEMSWEA